MCVHTHTNVMNGTYKKMNLMVFWGAIFVLNEWVRLIQNTMFQVNSTSPFFEILAHKRAQKQIKMSAQMSMDMPN